MKKLTKYEYYCDFYIHSLRLSFGIQDALDFTKDKQFIESLKKIQQRADKNTEELFQLCKEYSDKLECQE